MMFLPIPANQHKGGLLLLIHYINFSSLVNEMNSACAVSIAYNHIIGRIKPDETSKKLLTTKLVLL